MTPEKPFDEAVTEGISRRKVLKRIGGGVAIAWTAPVLTSIRTPAFAQTPRGCSPCSDILCFGANTCGGKDTCVCTRTTEGDCVCADGQCFCGAFGGCNTSADCLVPGTRCMVVCCTGALQCAAPCGTCSANANSSGLRQGDKA